MSKQLPPPHIEAIYYGAKTRVRTEKAAAYPRSREVNNNISAFSHILRELEKIYYFPDPRTDPEA